ncbi:MAG TPA: hypothetical protein VJN42_12020, partial [Candidatus Acidoferrum sp.]|nr:hypothetical protein [Candidatus Acidoferrum sp.]
GDWSTANSSVATVDYYGTHTGQGVGSTTSDTFAEEEWYVSKYSCPIMQRHSRGAANVKPKILLGGSNGTDITNTTQNVVVGQQIILYGSYALPSGSTFTNQSWTIPNAWTDTSQPQTTVVGGFNVASDFSTGGPTPVTTTTQRTTTFYWVAAASSQTITFTLNYKDANGTVQHAAATTTFTVNGPTSLVIQTPEGQITVNPGPVLQFGGPNSNPTDGITFSASATPPTGFSNSFFWAQLILGDTFTFTTTGGTTQVCTVNSLGLDNTYPYYPPKDSPFFSLSSGDTKSTRNFSARMFVMWSSNLPNSIPVPVASVSWGFYADASFGSTWTVQSDSSVTTPTITTGATYPSWTSLYTNNGPTTCH